MKIGKDDEVARFLLLSNSHDGSMSLRINITPIRVVCWNTLSAAFGIADRQEDAGKVAITRFWHTKGVKDRLYDFGQQLARVRTIYDETQDAYNLLAEKSLVEEEVDAYIKELFPIKEDAKRPGRMEGIRNTVREEFEAGAGSDLKAAHGTMWGLYNAVAAFTDHKRGKDADNRLHSAWFGDSVRLKERALNLAVTMS